MNRGTLVVVGGFALLGVGITAGVLLAASTVPPPDPLPVTTHLAPPTAAPVPTPGYTRAPGEAVHYLEPGDVLVTEAELRAYAEGIEWRVGDPDEWAAYHALLVECVAGKGFWWDPRLGNGPTILARRGCAPRGPRRSRATRARATPTAPRTPGAPDTPPRPSAPGADEERRPGQPSNGFDPVPRSTIAA